MSDLPADRPLKKTTLDKDLKKIVHLERAVRKTGRSYVPLGVAALFLVAVGAFMAMITGSVANAGVVIAAGVIGGYMAMNIGANDVANNVGPAVGSKALTMLGALVIAAVFETAGAIIAGGEVVATISKGIIDPGSIASGKAFILVMMAALLSAAAWINIATWIGAPVSTTHAIAGSVLGAGITAAGFAAVDWHVMTAIAASWVISPVLGGLIAAGLLLFIKIAIVYRDDRIAAARRWVPVLIAIMACAFTVYLVMKGLKNLWKPPLWMVGLIAVGAFAGAYAAVKPMIRRASAALENRRKSVSGLFTVPLVFSAALLSFAHGANDVANAVGPLAAIVSAVESGGVAAATVTIPGWVLFVGAVGISMGLLLFGPKLIRTVGEKITKLDQIRAFCVALSAAVTVIVASGLGLPVSSTHIAVGGVFGVGFLREYRANWKTRQRTNAKTAAATKAAAAAKAGGKTTAPTTPSEKKIQKAERRRLVRRNHLVTIVAAWIITVPLSALLAAVIYLILDWLV